VPSTVQPDVGSPGAGLPAIVLSVAGSAPDYAGTQFLVFRPDGEVVVRSSGFQSGQPLPNTTTWTTNGSNPQVAHWQLVDALS
jgi:hypothetical protein